MSSSCATHWAKVAPPQPPTRRRSRQHPSEGLLDAGRRGGPAGPPPLLLQADLTGVLVRPPQVPVPGLFNLRQVPARLGDIRFQATYLPTFFLSKFCKVLEIMSENLLTSGDYLGFPEIPAKFRENSDGRPKT